MVLVLSGPLGHGETIPQENYVCVYKANLLKNGYTFFQHSDSLVFSITDITTEERGAFSFCSVPLLAPKRLLDSWKF